MSSELEFTPNEGYTALEQYDNSHKMCPATDIYAFSACIFRALVGQNPPDAKSRETNDKLMIPNAIAEKIPTHVIKALGGGLQIYPEKRIQDIETFRQQLSVTPGVVAAAAIQPKPVEKDPVEEEEHYRGYPDYDMQKPKSKAPKIIIAILVVLIIAAVALGIYFVKNGGFSNEQDNTTTTAPISTYSVPDFVSAGYTQSDVENNGVWNEQFTITFDTDYSEDVEEGIIFKQSVEAGETVDQGTQIVLTVSRGIQTEVLPDVGGMTLEDAKKELEELGFTVSTVEIYNDGGHTKDTVKSSYGMAPAAGEEVAVGEEVILQVYGEVITTTQPSTTQEDKAE